MNIKIIIFLISIILLNTTISFSDAVETPILIDYAESFSEGLSKVGIWKGYWEYGYLDVNGSLRIPTKYNYASNFKEGFAIVGIGKDNNLRKFGYIKKDGSILYPIELDYAGDFDLGYAVIGNKSSTGLKKGLIDSNGKIVVETIYDDIDFNNYASRYGYAITKKSGLYGLVDLESGKIFETKYASIIFLDNFIRTSSNTNSGEKYGIISYSGNIVEPVYDWIHYYDGIDNVMAKVEINNKFGLINNNLTYALDPKYDEIRHFADMTSHVKLNDKYGYLDTDGSMLTPIEYDEITAFVRGVSYVKKNNKWGLLNINGTYKVEPKYDQIYFLDGEIQAIDNGKKVLLTEEGDSKFDPSYEYMYPFPSIEGALKVKKSEKEIILDSNGEKIFSSDFDTIGGFGDIYEGLAYITLEDKMGYLSISGEYKVEPIYDGAFKDTKKDYFHTKLNNKWGIIFNDGTIIKPKFDNPLSFEKDFGVAIIGGKQTYIKRNGEFLTSKTFDQIYKFSDGMGKVYTNKKIRYINSKGNLIKGSFDFGNDFNNGYALVYENGKYRFINKDGDYSFTFHKYDGKFLQAKSFSNGLAPFMDESGKWGYLDTSGIFTIENLFDHAYSFSNSINSKDKLKIAPVRLNNNLSFIDAEGRFIENAPVDYTTGFDLFGDKCIIWRGERVYTLDNTGKEIPGITSILKNDYIVGNLSENMIPLKVIAPLSYKELYGYVNIRGSWIIKPQFDHAVKFNSGYGQVFKDGKKGKVSKNGDVTWD